MWVAQSWDDGVVDDIRLTSLLRGYAAPATFNLNLGLHQQQRSYSWQYGDKEIWRLGLDELVEVYADFSIANHSLTHPYLTDLTMPDLQREIAESRRLLEDLLQQPVRGFCYPFGAYNALVQEVVRNTGHIYARTVIEVETLLPSSDNFAFGVSCWFNHPQFWQRYEQAKAANSGFLFWGHSYELVNESMWAELEHKIAAISSDPSAEWSKLDTWFAD